MGVQLDMEHTVPSQAEQLTCHRLYAPSHRLHDVGESIAQQIARYVQSCLGDLMKRALIIWLLVWTQINVPHLIRVPGEILSQQY